MWPKALAQLIELAPHLARLLPMADRFFQSKTADAEASRSALEQMAEGLRGDLGQVTASHAGLYRQLNDQSEKLSTLTADVAANQRSLDSIQARLTRIERAQKLQRLLTVVALILIVALCVYVVLRLH
jgi:septal ring factor EnvC (AmiA/AmiB activator)